MADWEAEQSAVSSEWLDYLPDVRRFARSLSGNRDVADEVSQETLLRALQSNTSMASLSNPRAWLFRIAANIVREWWRKQGRRAVHEEAAGAAVNRANDRRVDDSLAQREHLQNVWSFVQGLPEKQRQVLILRVVEQCSIPQIAEQLHISRGAVRVNLSHARAKLRAKFGASEGCGIHDRA